MSFDRLCDIHIDHEYYNDTKSKRLEMKLVPSDESVELIRKKRIIIRNNGSSFSLYGDIYNSSAELMSEFKLSFAVVVEDAYFINASDIAQSSREALPAEGGTLRQGNRHSLYYFHNKRTDLIDGKAYLSNTAVIGADDQVPLNPAHFVKEQLADLSNISLSSGIKYSSDDDLNAAFTYRALSDPSEPAEIRRSLEVDLGPFSGGHYTFSYSHDPGTGPVDETASFYLENRFAEIRPFAVIDLFFYSDISSNYSVLDRDFYISIGARESTWRYNIISRYNTYEELTIVSIPAGAFPLTGTKKTLKNGESATVFESLSKLKTGQILENTYELNGKHVETLGIGIGTADDGEEDEVEEEPSESTPANAGLIRRLPTPKAENLVLEMVTVGDHEEAKFFSDLFIYI